MATPKQRHTPAGPSEPPIPHQHASQSKPKVSTSIAKQLAKDQNRILKLSLLVRLASIALLIICSHVQQSFDTSHQLLSYSLDPQLHHSLSSGPFHWLLSFVRWDTIYFLSSAAPSSGVHQGGYVWEQSIAFQPGIITLLRWTGYITPSMDGSWSPTSAILFTTLLANLAAMASPVLLHRLTWRVTKNEQLSYTAAVLSIFAPAAGTTLSSPTPEPFFSLASLLGLHALESATTPTPTLGWGPTLIASFWFGIATLFRVNGALLLGYIAFKLLREAREGRLIGAGLKGIFSAATCIGPSVLFQIWAYTRFCLGEEDRRPWCTERVPSVYTFVQSHYWNVGLFRYWEPAQLPNFALALPVLLVIGYTGYAYFRDSTPIEVFASLITTPPPATAPPSISNVKKVSEGLALRSTPKAVPYVVHGLVLGLVLSFASHVQIALRFATPGGIPMIWWGLAHEVLDDKHSWIWKVVVGYIALQMCAGIVLYAGFYPPA